MPHSFLIEGLSHIGRTRARNEDSMALEPDAAVVVVADGMGGHPGGDVASRVAADVAASTLTTLLSSAPEHRPDEHDTTGRLSRAMSRSVLAAHGAVRDRGRSEPGLNGMGTTLIGWVADADTGADAVGHVGDSRAYRLRRGVLERLTRDDTWVQERVDAHEFTPEEARRHPFGHMLTQCVGLDEPPTPHVGVGHVEDGDVYLLCTDGLVGMLEDAEIRRIVGANGADRPGADHPGAVARALVDAANERGGRDNITVALVVVRPAPEDG